MLQIALGVSVVYKWACGWKQAIDLTTWGCRLSQLCQRQTGRLSWLVVDTVVLWGISLLPHGRQREERLKSDPLHLRVWRLAIVVHLALLSKMNVWSTAWENAVCVKCGHVWAMWRLCHGNSKDKGTRDITFSIKVNSVADYSFRQTGPCVFYQQWSSLIMQQRAQRAINSTNRKKVYIDPEEISQETSISLETVTASLDSGAWHHVSTNCTAHCTISCILIIFTKQFLLVLIRGVSWACMLFDSPTPHIHSCTHMHTWDSPSSATVCYWLPLRALFTDVGFLKVAESKSSVTSVHLHVGICF